MLADGRQLNNLSPSSGVQPSVGNTTGGSNPELIQSMQGMSMAGGSHPHALQGPGHMASQPSGGVPLSHQQSVSMPALPAPASLTIAQQLAVRYHTNVSFSPLPFHHMVGRNVILSAEKTVAVRKPEEYCNGYVFTNRPLQCGEKLVIQVLSVDNTFHGGIAFGMTACDPSSLISSSELPDDSDSLLDRPEYWVVNKDVCTNPDVADELSFHLTEEGGSFSLLKLFRNMNMHLIFMLSKGISVNWNFGSKDFVLMIVG